jgi:beta-glucosidase-like glycosyl hydrolase/CubicO group peptidase (beta-lactamase class C family)
MTKLITLLSILSTTFLTSSLPVNHFSENIKNQPPFIQGGEATEWVDKIFKTLSKEERIAQLFMVAAYSNRDKAHVNKIDNLIKNYKIGGLIFFQGGPIRQANLTNRFQNESKVPLLISIDGEWGLAMRLDSTMKFPKQMTLGAIQDTSEQLIYEMGKQIANQCKALGMHVNLAPVADINNNPKNPIISYRSFGENKYTVARKSLAYMKGMQDHGIMANAKHFPGHGDTDSDSHKTLPIINHTKERLDSLELYPFKYLIDSGLGSIMVAHLYMPKIDSTPNRASTLSPKIVTDLLKKELQFEGLIFTDALNMKGVSKYYEPGKVDVAALLAGNDVLLFSEDVPRAIDEIKKAILKKEITQKEIDKRCKKILYAKYWAGLDKVEEINTETLASKLYTEKAKNTNVKLFQNAITLLQNKNDIIPLKRLDTLKIASISFGAKNENEFNTSIDRYANFSTFSYPTKVPKSDISSIYSDCKDYNLLMITIHDMNQRPYQNFGVSQSLNDIIDSLASNHKIILNILGNPYCLNKFTSAKKAEAVVMSYEEHPIAKDLSGQLIFGGIPALGKLSVTASDDFPINTGIIIKDRVRFNYTSPSALGMDQKILNTIDSIALTCINDSVFPGCQVFAARNGQVFFQKSFGHHTYNDKRAVVNSDIYDLASITKIASSTASLMKMESEKLINVDSTLSTYLGDMVDTSAYKNTKLVEMLTHQAGFTPWIPFYIRTLKYKKPLPELYNKVKTNKYSERVAENLYAVPSLRDSIFSRILNKSISDRKKYKYSDIGYYFINEIIARQTKLKQDEYVSQSFYSPLGLGNIGYKPRDLWVLDRIVPTEKDISFRHQLIHGDVHDQGAAMLNGVCGHAGLFSNSNDLAVMMQLFMQYGTYGGERYFDQAVVKKYTSSPYFITNNNRRGIGFDKPVREGGSGPTCSKCTSDLSFGHSGFTGTVTWADPENGLVYVFLSNRVYPDASNKKIISTSVRTRIQQLLYDAIDSIKE